MSTVWCLPATATACLYAGAFCKSSTARPCEFANSSELEVKGVSKKVHINEKNRAHFEDGSVDNLKMLAVFLVPLSQAIRVLDSSVASESNRSCPKTWWGPTHFLPRYHTVRTGFERYLVGYSYDYVLNQILSRRKWQTSRKCLSFELCLVSLIAKNSVSRLSQTLTDAGLA